MNKTFFQTISIFTARCYLKYNEQRGDTRHSYLNDVTEDFKHINHKNGFMKLKELVDHYRKISAFKTVLIYDNINDVCIYKEVYDETRDKYKIHLDCSLSFTHTVKGNYLYAGFFYYDQYGGKQFNTNDQKKVLRVAQANWEYLKKKVQTPILHQGKVREERTA